MPTKPATHRQRLNKLLPKTTDDRPSSAKRGYDYRWTKIRKQFLESNPLCYCCKRNNRATPATLVHHIIPLRNGGTHNTTNLMSVCRFCHAKLHATDNITAEKRAQAFPVYLI